jgi:hypothetical protein
MGSYSFGMARTMRVIPMAYIFDSLHPKGKPAESQESSEPHCRSPKDYTGIEMRPLMSEKDQGFRDHHREPEPRYRKSQVRRNASSR